MQLASSAAAVPAVALLGTEPAFAAGADRSVWNAALRQYHLTKDAYDRVSTKHDEATAAFKREQPKANPDFEKYGLEWPLSTDRNRRIRDTEIAIIVADYKGRELLTPDDYGTIAKKAAQLVDERSAYGLARDEAYERTIGKIHDDWERELGKLYTARDKLLDTPAPDTEALLYKLELLSADMEESESDYQQDVVTLREDARRLFVS